MKTSPVSFFFVRLAAALFALSAGLAPSALAADEDQPATKADIMRLDGRITDLSDRLDGRISDLSNRMSRLEGTLEGNNERLSRLEGTVGGNNERLNGRISDISDRLSRLEGTNELLAMMATGSFLCLMGLLVALVVDILVRTRKPATAS